MPPLPIYLSELTDIKSQSSVVVSVLRRLPKCNHLRRMERELPPHSQIGPRHHLIFDQLYLLEGVGSCEECYPDDFTIIQTKYGDKAVRPHSTLATNDAQVPDRISSVTKGDNSGP